MGASRDYYLNGNIMMRYGYDYGGDWGMMGGAGALGIITWIVVMADLVLAGIWLWKQIKK
jgi:hypothetical protein